MTGNHRVFASFSGVIGSNNPSIKRKEPVIKRPAPQKNFGHVVVDVPRLINYVALGFKGLHPEEVRKF